MVQASLSILPNHSRSKGTTVSATTTWNGSIVNDLLVVLSGVQLISGLVIPFFEDIIPKLAYMLKGWFTHQLNHLSKMKATLWIAHQWYPMLQRIGNESLMEKFQTISRITPGKLATANWCRLHARVITISDMTNISGTWILESRLWGQWRDWNQWKANY